MSAPASRAPAHLWRVTHSTWGGRRHQVLVTAPGSAQASAWAEQLYGPARVQICVRLAPRTAEAAARNA